MPLKCPKGTSPQYRMKRTKTGKLLRLGGCMRIDKFIKNGVKEVKILEPKVKLKK